MAIPYELLPGFDCRLGAFKDKQQATNQPIGGEAHSCGMQALALVLWRAYDSGVNGISDSIHQCKGKSGCADAHQMMKQNSRDKLQWLHRHQMLPLHPVSKLHWLHWHQMLPLHSVSFNLRAKGAFTPCLLHSVNRAV